VGSNLLMYLWQDPHHTDHETYQKHSFSALRAAARVFCSYVPKIARVASDFISRHTRRSEPNANEEAQSSRNTMASDSQPQQDVQMNTLENGNAHNNTQVKLQTEDFRSSYVFLRTPKKVGDKLQHDDEEL